MDNTTKVIVWVVGIAVVLIGGWFLFMGNGSGHSDSGPITLGFMGPLTGDTASLGTIARSAVEVAVEEINAKGGVDGRMLNVVYEDSQCSAQPASSAAAKLISTDKVTAIIGGLCSSETSAFAKQAMDNKVITFSYCSSAPNLSQTGKYFFRDYPSDALQGKFMAEYAYNTLGVRQVAIMYHISDWGTGIKDVFSERFQELGGTIVAVEGAPQESRDYRTALSKIKASNAPYIYMPMYSEGSIVALQQAKQLGVTAQIFGGDAWSDPKFQQSVSGLGTFLYSEVKLPDATAFNQKIQERTSADSVPICASQAYDAVYILADALAEAGTDPDDLADAIRSTKYNGVSGHVEFDENGDLKGGSYVVKRVQNGSSTEVQ